MVRNYTDDEILSKVKSLDSFNGWPKDILNVWVRSKADEYDKFDDKCYTYDCTSGKPKFVMVRTGTTNAGSVGLKNFKTYNRLGCAVLMSNTIVYYSHQYGLHKGKTPAYVQCKSFPYTRDNNMNDRAENYGTIYYDIIGANDHPAGAFSKIINNWSLACLVSDKKAQYDKWLSFMNKRKLTTAIIDEF